MRVDDCNFFLSTIESSAMLMLDSVRDFVDNVTLNSTRQTKRLSRIFSEHNNHSVIKNRIYCLFF